MLRFKTLLSLLSAAVALFFSGCEMVAETPEGEAVVKLDIYELNLDGEGGNIPIYYTVENPRSNAHLKVTSNVDWITVKHVKNGEIMLYVAPSDVDEERFGFVTISYEGMPKSIKVPVLQDAQILNEFSFEVSDLTTSSCSVKYIPKQSGELFMANIIDSDFFTQSGIHDMNQFIETEMANYLSLAAQYEITLQYLLEEAVSPKSVFTSEVTRKFSGMKAGGKYMVYAYGLELNGNEYRVTIPLHSIYVTTPLKAFYDVKFNVKSHVTSGGTANIVVSPVNWSGYYVVNIIPDSSVYYVPKGEVINEYTIRAMGDDFYKRARYAMQDGVSADAFLRSSCYKGERSFNTTLSGGSKYMVVVYAVESADGKEIPSMCSIPTIAYL